MPRKDFHAVRDKFANDSGLPFGRILTREHVLRSLEAEGHEYRQRVFCPLVTLWAWLSQCLSQDKSLNEAVTRILAHRVATGLPACSASSASYSDARSRFPLPVMVRLAKQIGRNVHNSADGAWHWRDQEVFLVDGTGLSMPDTPENQLAFPQIKSIKKGLGFPVMRAVAMISLATGAVVDFDFAAHEGKGTGEGTLLRGMLDTMNRGDILVADRYYPSFSRSPLSPTRHRYGFRQPPYPHCRFQRRVSSLVKMTTSSNGTGRAVITERIGANSIACRIQSTSANSDRHRGTERGQRKGHRHQHDDRSVDSAKGTGGPVLASLELRTRSAVNQAVDAPRRAAVQESRNGRERNLRHLLAYNLLRGTMTESAKRTGTTPRQLSVKGAMQAVESFTPAMMATNGSEVLYAAFLTTVSAHRVGNRPGGRNHERRNDGRHGRIT